MTHRVYEGGRGLAFICYQTDIVRQFGRLITEWVNSSASPNGGGGHDLLIGQVADPQTGERVFDVPSSISDGHQTWVFPTGGAFMFTPSMSALRALSSFSPGRAG